MRVHVKAMGVSVVIALVAGLSSATAASERRPRVTIIGDSVAASILYTPQAASYLRHRYDLKLDLEVGKYAEVKEILGGGERKPTQAFSELQSHCLFAAKFGRPGKGNDKGNVEGLVGYARRNFMVPVPRVASWEELNAHLLEECGKRRERKLWGHAETIGQRFERDREKLLPLPAAP